MWIGIALAGLVVAAIAAWFALRPRALAKLTLKEGREIGLDFPIFGKSTTIGSEEGQTVVISHPRVSRLHADLDFEDGQFVLRDRSKQGTTVNGQPVTETTLRSGDLIRLAESVELIFTRLG
jgi:pSer/pThr/pTyr-binding forkhead associated (FHA) protein